METSPECVIGMTQDDTFVLDAACVQGVMQEVWQRADSYEAYIGRWSRQVARRFVSELAVAPGGIWIDVGCGSGALTAAILAVTDPARVLALDRSIDFVVRSSRSYPA